MKRNVIRMTSETSRIVKSLGWILASIVLVMVYLILNNNGAVIIPLAIAAVFMAAAIRLTRANGYVSIDADTVTVRQSLFDTSDEKSASIAGFDALKIQHRAVHNAQEHAFSYFYLSLLVKNLSANSEPAEVCLSSYYNSRSPHKVMKKARQISNLTGLPIEIAKDHEIDFQ